MDLNGWFESQPPGAMTEMLWKTKERGTPVSWATICRAKRGQRISERMAKVISKYTGGKVPISSLTGGKAKTPVTVRARKRQRRRAA